MARRSNFHNEPPELDQRRAVEKQTTRSEFARRLQRALVIKGWTQAALSRKAQEVAEAEGTGIRVGPDSISHYMNGRYMPSPTHVNIIAKALDIDVLELLPAKGVPEAGESLPPIGVQDLNNGHAWLRVNQAVPWPVAVKILSLLRGEE
jgi:transcriptional regulator with XRE-family HTH domain